MVSLAYNVGIGRLKPTPKGFIASAVLANHRHQNFEAAANCFSHFTKQAGKSCLVDWSAAATPNCALPDR
jgi:GH24 family phage-related lysozyme (muramidase)